MCVFSPHLFSQRFHFVHFFPSSKAMISQVGVTPGAWKPSLPAAPFAVGDLGDSPGEIAWLSSPSLEVISGKHRCWLIVRSLDWSPIFPFNCWWWFHIPLFENTREKSLLLLSLDLQQGQCGGWCPEHLFVPWLCVPIKGEGILKNETCLETPPLNGQSRRFIHLYLVWQFLRMFGL